ncbi:jg8800 [Pararge aegeria aegeria]|uniref:Jg8800 protein n=1 Tax=Pararge aegeria aegeria TaxID=348720 RepID=A0A8S4S684_9NEOP|nr:jg8800 [Pararge aegeria aegeria]
MFALLKEGSKNTKGLHHPWQRTIKDVHINDIQTAHNCINNPHYPKKGENIPNKENRVAFTIIGDRVNKNFIHCVNLVKGLTTVEWPKVWNDLKLQHGGIAYCLQTPVAVMLNDKFLGGETELKEILEARYDYHLSLDYYREGIDNFVNYVRSSGLYADIVPYTCENFLRLCESKRGGYAGTPVHRIVKDAWIQCGGFGLKSTDLDCENFIIPHDRRGVLCMANEERHVDCSTQFFVLLQPATWMAHKYVAFGQLIDGESTLKAIETVPTFYESPTVSIQIEKAGVLNLECHGIRVSKSTNEYIQGHIEDLIALGDLLLEELIEKVFLELELKRVIQLEMENGEAEQSVEVNEEDSDRIRATERFLRKKEDLEKLQKSQTYTSRASSAVSDVNKINNDFDVDEYEPEEYSYQHVSIAGTAQNSVVVKPEKPFYIPLTDVPYPGEKDSTFDLKKLLRGDYCLESDLLSVKRKKFIGQHISYISDIYRCDDQSDNVSLESLSSADEQEIRRYLKLNVDRVSFAGSVIRNIARGIAKVNIFEDSRKSELITDEELRRFRKVSICSNTLKTKEPSKIKRRQTGFVRPEDLEKIYLISQANSRAIEVEDEESVTSITGARKVRIVESAKKVTVLTQNLKIQRKPTGYVQQTDSDTQVRRQSALSRLYDNMPDYMDIDEEGPTLRDYRSPSIKVVDKNYMLTQSAPMSRKQFSEEDLSKEHHLRQSITIEDSSIEQVFNLQHNKKFARKVSSDYVKTIDQIEHKLESSIRSVEFARTRPSMSVSEYQQKNMKHLATIKKTKASSSKYPSGKLNN